MRQFTFLNGRRPQSDARPVKIPGLQPIRPPCTGPGPTVKPRIAAFLLIVTFGTPPGALSDNGTPATSWLRFCDSAPGVDPTRVREYLSIDGSRRFLSLADNPDLACANVELEAPVTQVRWFARISREKAAALGRGVILQGLEDAEGVRISEVIVSDSENAGKAALPLKTNLLSALNGRVYGVEGRARLTPTGTGLILECREGEHPAGVVLRNDRARLPSGVPLELMLTAQASEPFGIGYADGINHALAAPKRLGALRVSATADPQTFSLAAPADSIAATPDVAFTLQCPKQASSLTLSTLELSTAHAGPAPARSIWIWRPSEWRDNAEALLEELDVLDTPVVYVSVPLTSSASDHLSVANADALADFIARAAARNIRVWAVEGDPHAVLPEGQEHFLRRAKALDAYNAAQDEKRRLAGVQYDIEPYLLPEFALDQDAWLRAYVETIARLKAELEVPLEVAVPFWWAELSTGGAALLDQLAPHVDGVNVMNYRTDPVLLQQFAEPFLAWGTTSGVAVRIALEAGPIASEDRWHYRRDASGGLRKLTLAGEPVLVLLDSPQASPSGLALSLSHQSQLDGSQITFKGDLQKMQAVMADLEILWRAWPSFAGLALHEYRLADLPR